MAHYQSTYRVKVGENVKLLFFPLGFHEGLPNLFEELVIGEVPLKFGEAGYNEVPIHKRGLNILKLDKTKTGSLLLTSEERKAKMKPIYVVNMKYLEGKKLAFQEFVDYFFSIEVKILFTGVEQKIDKGEFPMNSYHDEHINYLLQHTPHGVRLHDFLQLGMFDSLNANSFINQMHAQHLFYLKVYVCLYRHMK